MEVLKSNLVAVKVTWLHPYRVPAAPARAAEVTKVIILYLVTLIPTLSAAMRLSRAAMMARPVRLLTRLKIMIRVIITKIKPAIKEEIRAVFITPMGPLISWMPPSPRVFLSLRKLNWKPSLSTPR